MIEITFDTSDGFIYDPGIEFVSSSIRLISPDSERQAIYFPVVLSSSVIAAEAEWLSSYPVLIDIWTDEPSLSDVRNHTYSYNLSNIWELLSQHTGTVYIGMVLGGTVPELRSTAPYNPVAYWNFNEGSLIESNLKGLDGTNYGAESVETNRGQGFSFLSGNYISFGNPSELQIINDQSISFWLYPRSFSVRSSIIHKAYGGELSIVLETDGTLSYYYGTSGTDGVPYQGFNSSISLELNKFTHVTIIRDLENMLLTWVINNIETAQTPALYDFATISTNNLLLGIGYENDFDGIIDELIIYDKALDVSDVKLIRSGTYTGVVEIPVGQMTVSSIKIFLENVWVPGNVISEKAYAYKGSDQRDTLLRLPKISEATENFSNVTFSADREILSYIIAYPSPDYLDIIIGLPKTQENLFLYVNDSLNSDWVANDLLGVAMDSNTITGITCSEVSKGSSSWILNNNSSIKGNISPEYETVTFYAVLRKTSLSAEDKAYFIISIGNFHFNLVIDDTTDFFNYKGNSIRKPNFPWTTNYIPIKIIFSPTNTKFLLYDQVLFIEKYIEHLGTMSLKVVSETECQLKSLYFGPLSDDEIESVNPDIKLIATGIISCTGELYLAGNQKMESIGNMYIMSDNIYLDKELYAKIPGKFLSDPVLFGIRDSVSGEEHLYYGSKTEYEIYRYDGEYWSLYLEARLFSIWRSLHTEGLLVQLPDESSIKIHLFKRENGKLVFRKYISFTGLPEENYLFEPTLDRRISQKTAPWVWAAVESLNGPG